ncbi:ovalbumin-like [Pipra filicauda]|uniref:Ovalbumin-like n=1 Tax=Pipra filicauda TaxID=649802 RepID=A0A6J2H854_9PASS|nr:ovalbumin-like [Pipra filicauda]
MPLHCYCTSALENTGFTMGSIGPLSVEFCCDVFKELRIQHARENIFYSPVTIISALSMVYLGARDNTKAQIEKAVHFDKIPGFGESIESQCGTSLSIHTSLKDIFTQITKPSDNYTVGIASRLYAEEKYPILPEYLQCIKELYKGGLEPISFQTAAEQARELINSWVESQTNGIIKNILQPSSVNPETDMVLVNAIYFKGLWEKAFKDEGTQTVPFRITEQESKPVQMMFQIGSFRVAEIASEKIRILELPYASGQLSLWVLLPDDISGLEQLETAITFENLKEWTSSTKMEERKIKVYLPRMKIEEKYNLTSVLTSLGITDLFSSSANLSGISSAERLKVSSAFHEASMEINEAGSKVVGAGVDDTSVSEEFRVDRPFLFLIKHNPSNSIFFFGRCFSP